MSVVKEGYVQQVIERYDGDPGMLIPMMQDLQAEYGYLPPEELRRLARELGTPLTRVYGVAMFYSSFRLSPKGRHEVTLCMGTVCYLKGSPRISQAICEEYGIQPGGTTTDRLFTLQAVNCVGACALAPVMVVDGKYYDGVTPDSALKILRGFGSAAEEAGASEPSPTAEPAAGLAPAASAAEPAPAAAAPAPAVAATAAPAPPKPSVAEPAAAPSSAPDLKDAEKPKAKAVSKPKPAGKAGKAAAGKKSGAQKAAAKTKPTDKKTGKKTGAQAGKPGAKKRSRP